MRRAEKKRGFLTKTAVPGKKIEEIVDRKVLVKTIIFGIFSQEISLRKDCHRDSIKIGSNSATLSLSGFVCLDFSNCKKAEVMDFIMSDIFRSNETAIIPLVFLC